MVSLKRDPKTEDDRGCAPCGIYGREYYPVSIYLHTEEIEKLGLEGVDVGDEMTLTIKVKVTSKSAREVEDDGKKTMSRSLDLSVVEAEKAEAPKSDADKANILFGGA